MEPIAYENMAKLEGTHWWFAGRRRVLGHVLSQVARSFSVGRPLRIVEVGCGTGGNLEMLSQFGEVVGVEPDAMARGLSAARGCAKVVDGRLPDGFGLEGETFDILAAFDVLEHLSEDAASLKAAAERLAPGGYAVLTVPAYPFLWSGHDEVHHHKRRYRRKQFHALITEAGLEVEKLSYFNSFLFPPAALTRLVMGRGRNSSLSKRRGKDDGDMDGGDMDKLPSAPINKALAMVFGLERFFLRFMSFPFGLSLLGVAKVPTSGDVGDEQ